VRKKVDVVNYPDGRFAVQCEGTPLHFQVFDKIQTVEPGAIVENKRLGAVLALVKEQQATYAPHERRNDPIWQRQPNNLEAPRPANEGSAIAAGDLRSSRLNRAIVFIVQRYVTENDDAKRP
jgi:hypothetical protein